MNEVFSIECTNMPVGLDPNHIFFVEREYEWYINQYIGRNSKRFVKAFSNFQYTFGYLPESKDMNLLFIVNRLLQASKDINHALCKFAYMEDGRAVFYCVELDNDEKEESLAKQFYHFACWCTVESDRQRKWKEWDLEEAKKREQAQLYGNWQCNATKRPHVQIVNDVDGLEQLEEFFEDMEEVQTHQDISSVDVQLEDIRRQLDALRAQGVSEERIRMALEPAAEISPVEVDADYRIYLPGLHKELTLQPVHKALFLLFLRHKEGILFKHIMDYRDELKELYVAVSDRVNPESIERTIESLCDPGNNSIHEKITNMTRSIVHQLGKQIGLNYCIRGPKGTPKSIALPEGMVHWGHVE